MPRPEDALDLVAAERHRQIVGQGYTHDHDQQHTRGELLTAALVVLGAQPGVAWPWPDTNPPVDAEGVDRLVKAAALLVAEIDRVNRVVDRDLWDPPGWPADAQLECTVRDRIATAVREVLVDADPRTADGIAAAVLIEFDLNGYGWVLLRRPTDLHHFAPHPEGAPS